VIGYVSAHKESETDMTKQVLKKFIGPLRRIGKHIRKSFGPEPMQPVKGADNLYMYAPGTTKQANEESMELMNDWWGKFLKENSRELVNSP
jgi:hypothetical protein